MIVENFNSPERNSKLEYLAYAQTISNFFIEALDQNDCNVKVVVGFYQELDDAIESIKDLDKAFKPTPQLPEFEGIRRPNSPIDRDEVIDRPLESEAITKAAIESLKEKCFRCHLTMPKINFHNDLKFSVEKVKGYIEIYKATFQNPFKGNYCHLAYSMQYTCIPDLVKMLGMCMTAYAAVLALNKLPTFSLNAFIKGVIGSLLAQIVGSLSISLDASSTGLPCVLGILEELAYKVPTIESTHQRFDETQKENWIQDYDSVEEYTKQLDEDFAAGIITTQEEYDAYLTNLKKTVDPITYYKDKLEEKVGDAEDAISNIFEQVNNLVGKAQEDINGYISAILGVVNFFECENKRSGPDFSEVMEYLQNLGTVINIFSALIAIIVPKTIFWELCKDEKSYNELKETMTETIQKPLSKTDLEEIIQEFTEHKAQISEDGLSVLIYDKPIKTRLPKLSLMGCNFKEFAEAHSLENIIKGSISDYLEEEDRKQEAIYKELEKGSEGLTRPGYSPRAPIRTNPLEFDRTPETPIIPTELVLDLFTPEAIISQESLEVKENSSYRDRVNEIVYDKFIPGIATQRPTVTQLYQKYGNDGLIGNPLIPSPTYQELKWVSKELDSTFKYHPYVKEDLIAGVPVFKDFYVPASKIYQHFQQTVLIDKVLNRQDPFFNNLDFDLEVPNYEVTQNSQDYSFGSTVDTSKIVDNLEKRDLKEGIEYKVTQKVDISLEDIIGSKGQFDEILDDIMDFIYNDPNPTQYEEDPYNSFQGSSDFDSNSNQSGSTTSQNGRDFDTQTQQNSSNSYNRVGPSESIEVINNTAYKTSGTQRFDYKENGSFYEGYNQNNNTGSNGSSSNNDGEGLDSFTGKEREYTLNRGNTNSSSTSSIRNQGECRSVEDVMNILKNIKT